MFRMKKENLSPMENHNSSQVTVVMVPLAAQGHLNQLLHLSRLIATHNIPVHYVGSVTHIRQAKLRLHGWDLSNIHFIEFPIPTFTTPPPDHSASHKFPSQLVPALTATTHLRHPVHAFVGGLSAAFRRVIVIYDALMAYVVQDMASIHNAHCYLFRSFSCFCTCSWEAQEWSDLPIPPAAAGSLNQVPSVKGYYSKEFQDFLDLQFGAKEVSCGEIINSCREIEGLYLDLWAQGIYKKGGLTLWAMGPFNPAKIPRKTDHECLKWLNKQPQNSVIFISFGTTTTFSDEQMGEIAAGLERSKQRFIWVARGADKGDIFTGNSQQQQQLPEGFEERVRKRGIVVREWAPQMEILGHRSTGGFMSHCGWNSCLESITSGVPMAAWPMHSDQPANAVLVARVLGIGVEVESWTRQGTGVVAAGRVEEVVNRLMLSTEGNGMRKRAAELGAKIRNSILQSEQIESFIAHITNT